MAPHSEINVGLEDAAESGVCSPAAGSSEPGSGAERPLWAPVQARALVIGAATRVSVTGRHCGSPEESSGPAVSSAYNALLSPVTPLEACAMAEALL